MSFSRARYSPKARASKARKVAAKARRKTADILPAQALEAVTDHPLDATLRGFLTNQAAFVGFKEKKLPRIQDPAELP